MKTLLDHPPKKAKFSTKLFISGLSKYHFWAIIFKQIVTHFCYFIRVGLLKQKINELFVFRKMKSLRTCLRIHQSSLNSCCSVKPCSTYSNEKQTHFGFKDVGEKEKKDAVLNVFHRQDQVIKVCTIWMYWIQFRKSLFHPLKSYKS